MYNFIFISAEYFLLYFLGKPIVIHSFIETDRVEFYTIQFLPV